MKEQLLRKIIRIKLEVGTAILDEMPPPIQDRGKRALELLQEEIQSCLNNIEKKAGETKRQHSKLTGIEID